LRRFQLAEVHTLAVLFFAGAVYEYIDVENTVQSWGGRLTLIYPSMRLHMWVFRAAMPLCGLYTTNTTSSLARASGVSLLEK